MLLRIEMFNCSTAACGYCPVHEIQHNYARINPLLSHLCNRLHIDYYIRRDLQIFLFKLEGYNLKYSGFISILIPLVGLFAGCGAQMRNMPVGTQKMQVSASIGGPMVDAFGRTVPIPYGLIGATYGISNEMETYIDYHVTATVFKFLGVTPGVVYFPSFHYGRLVPALGFDALIFSDIKATRVYPELVTSSAYRLSERWTPYIALRHTFQEGPAPHYIPSAMAGTSCRSGRMQYFIELQWLALDHDNRWNPVEYHGISNRGAMSLQFGATLDLPIKKGRDK